MQGKTLNIINNENILLKLIYILGAIVIVTQVIGLDFITSICFNLTFVVVAFLWLAYYTKQKNKWDSIIIAVAIFSLACIIIDGILNDVHISPDYFKKYIMFIVTILFLQASFKFEGSLEITTVIHKLNTGIIIVLLFAYLFAEDPMHTFHNGVLTEYLTFSFTNPNLVAMFLLCIFMTEFIYLIKMEKDDKEKTAFHAVFTLFAFFFVIETQSRNCLIALAIFLALAAYIYLKGHLPRDKRLILLVVMSPLLFAFLYLFVIEATWFNELFGFLGSEQKQLSSRVEMWQYGMNSFIDSPIIGAYGQIREGCKHSHLHNVHMEVLGHYGLVVFVTLCTFLYKNIKKLASHKAKKIDELYLAAFIAAYAMGFGEAAFVSGGLGIYIYICSFILLWKGSSLEK